MGTFTNPSPYARGLAQRSLTGRWNGLPPHNYSLHLTDAVTLHRDSASLPRSADASQSIPIPMDVSSRFGRRLRELRAQRNLTQCEMARRFGIDRSFISDVERGRKSISLPMLEVIALGMSLSLAELLGDL